MAISSMSRVLSAVSMAAVLISGVSAFAADLPTHKAAPAAPASTINWAGFYAGVEGGVGVADTDWTTTGTALGAGILDNTSAASFSEVGGRFGVYAGYNIMATSTVVAGVEGDIAADFFRSGSQSGIPGTLTLVPGPNIDSVTAKSSAYDASIRARVGTLVTPSTLVYATGGVAFADPKYSINCPSAAAPNNVSWCATPENGSVSPTQIGWTVGVGVETILGGNWVARGEYRFAGFPDKTTTFFPSSATDALTVKTSYYTNTINLGIAYKF